MGVVHGGNLKEVIMLQRKNVVMGAGGAETGAWVNVQGARGYITPLRGKLELRTGGRANGQHFKLLVYANAFGVPYDVTVRDRFLWEGVTDRYLRIDAIIERPRQDMALEFEVYLDE